MPSYRHLGGLLLLLALLTGAALPAAAQTDAAQADASGQTTVDVIEAVGVLDGPLTGFVIDSLQRSEAGGAAAVVIRLDTPGALGGDVDALVDAITGSSIPVVVYVGTPGARALGAGVTVGTAADVLALAPATTYGVAAPQDLRDLDDPAAAGAEAVADRLVALGAETDRGAEFLTAAAGGAAVVAVPDGEAGAPLSPDADLPDRIDADQVRTLDETALVEEGIADVVEPTLQGVLSRLVDLQVQTAAGTTTLDIDPVTANVRFINANLLVRILHTAASPVLAYLLLLGGALALFFEVFQPGFGVAGFSAIGVLGLGAYSLIPLPVEPLWAAVAVAGLLLLAYDLAVAGLSWPSALGTVLLGVGSFQMWAVEELTPPGWLLVLGTLSASVFFVFLMTTVLRAQGNQALLGAQAVEGKVGVVRSPLTPEGHVFVGGALWRARAPEGAARLRTGTKVRVLGLNDKLTLDVAPVEDESPVGA